MSPTTNINQLIEDKIKELLDEYVNSNNFAGNFSLYGRMKMCMLDFRAYLLSITPELTPGKFNHTRGDSELTPCGACITNENIANRLNALEQYVLNIESKLEKLKEVL